MLTHLVTNKAIEEVAREIAIKVANNCGSVPNLTFPDIYLGLVEVLSAYGWQPIETAPKDGTAILGLCNHAADLYYVAGRLTDYGARVEGLGHVPDGAHVIIWEPSQEVSDGPEFESFTIPAGWCLEIDCEQIANPTHWMPIPPMEKP